MFYFCASLRTHESDSDFKKRLNRGASSERMKRAAEIRTCALGCFSKRVASRFTL
jgi:hypothetical protein